MVNKYKKDTKEDFVLDRKVFENNNNRYDELDQKNNKILEDLFEEYVSYIEKSILIVLKCKTSLDAAIALGNDLHYEIMDADLKGSILTGIDNKGLETKINQEKQKLQKEIELQKQRVEDIRNPNYHINLTDLELKYEPDAIETLIRYNDLFMIYLENFKKNNEESAMEKALNNLHEFKKKAGLVHNI